MKQYGIKVSLPEGDTMRAAHLLGESWEGFRWYATAAERDAAYQDMLRELPNYRRGDLVTQVLEKVQR